MDPLKIYEYLMRARRRVFDWTRTLSVEDYTREILPGQRTLAQILTHTMTCEWAYLQRIQGLPVPPYEQWPIREEAPPSLAALEAAWTDQASHAQAVLKGVRDWDAELELTVTADDGRRFVIQPSLADVFTQLALHEVHHRGQAMLLLRRLGVAVEDIDYNVMMYKRRAAEPA